MRGRFGKAIGWATALCLALSLVPAVALAGDDGNAAGPGASPSPAASSSSSPTAGPSPNPAAVSGASASASPSADAAETSALQPEATLQAGVTLQSTTGTSKASNAKAQKAQSRAAKAAKANKAARKAARKLSKTTNKMYRLFNLWTGSYIFTASAKECRALVKANWLYEGVGWLAPKKSSVPVYRMYRKRTGDHVYTMSVAERNKLRRAGWKYEGIAWYSDENATVPVYQQVGGKGKARKHRYTASAAERRTLRRAGWKNDGVGWYGVSAGWSVAPKYRHAHWERLLSIAGKGRGGITVDNGSISKAARSRLKSFLGGTYVDFIGINTKTGKVVAYHPDTTHYGASTCKAPLVAALCMYDAPGIGGWDSRMYGIVTHSSNELYMDIAGAYGLGWYNRLAADSGLSGIRYTGGGPFAEFTPRELAQLWATIANYIKRGGPNVDLFKRQFGNGGYFKEGWMYAGMYGGQLHHVAGVDGDCVYAIMTGYPRPNDPVWDIKGALMAALK